MSFEYGSDGLGIKNPFKVEGFLKMIRGGITFGLGLMILLSIPDNVKISPYFGWATTITAFILLTFGTVSLGKGIMQVVRFFVGRNAPTSLSKNFAEARNETENTSYSAIELEQMMLNRTNSTFKEPKGIVELLLHTFVPKLTFAPIAIRNIAQIVTSAGVKTTIAIISMLLATFVLYSGLINLQSAFVFNVFALVMIFYFITIWFKAGRPINKKDTQNIKSVTVLSFVRTLIFSVSIPVAISYGLAFIPTKYKEFIDRMSNLSVDNMSNLRLEESLILGFTSEFNIKTIIIMIAVFMAIAVFYAFIMTYFRTKKLDPETNTSESRESWDKDVHPKEIFINLEQIVMAKRRYKNIPNRNYLKFAPELAEGAGGKGSYRGKFLQETQPKVEEVKMNFANKAFRLAGTIFGQVLLGTSALMIYMIYSLSPDIISAVESIIRTDDNITNSQMFTLGQNAFSVVFYLLSTLVFITFGRLFSNLSHIYWAEMIFSSKLLYLNCEGTFNESRITMGKGVYDSAQSDNIVTKTSNTSICIASEIYTSTFVGVGSKNLELPRHIITMKDASIEMNAIMDELKHNLDNKKKIASIDNENDLDTINSFNQMNSTMANQRVLSNNQKVLTNGHELTEQSPDNHIGQPVEQS